MFWDFSNTQDDDVAKLWPVHQMNDTEKTPSAPNPTIVESAAAPSGETALPTAPEMPTVPVPPAQETPSAPVIPPPALDNPTVPGMGDFHATEVPPPPTVTPPAADTPTSIFSMPKTEQATELAPEVPPTSSAPESGSLEDVLKKKHEELGKFVSGLSKANKEQYENELGAVFGQGKDQIFILRGTTTDPNQYTVISPEGFYSIQIPPDGDTSLSRLIAAQNMDQDAATDSQNNVTIQSENETDALYIEYGNDVHDFKLAAITPDQADQRLDKKFADVVEQNRIKQEQQKAEVAAEIAVATKYIDKLNNPSQ